ncbi:MAG: type II toxin-antitoxin system RelB/DinJ family antitoxin [Patescibacteria group bacterium]|nr:type II toxin-antitoxin system RelB/DinJ family antitoxin [Patescibacteria group bacterium]
MSTTKTSNIHARINPLLKEMATKVLDDLGISLTQFIELNLNQIVKDKDAKMELRLLKNDNKEEYTEIKDINHFRKLIGSK